MNKQQWEIDPNCKTSPYFEGELHTCNCGYPYMINNYEVFTCLIKYNGREIKNCPSCNSLLVDNDATALSTLKKMRQTQKYSQACQILTFQHASQDELYKELNRLGWWWKAKNKKWERDDSPAQEASTLIKIRIWASAKKVEQAAELFIENAEDIGLKILEKSEAYPCRPPNQNDSRIYLTFEELEN